MTEKKTVRIGIDVGGTFTHAVAIETETLSIVGRSKVPTTHSAKEGVAKGIIDSLTTLLAEAKISPTDVSFIAHSTTQATNALLEGDVAVVGILGLGKGGNAWLSNGATNIKAIELAPGKFLNTRFEFVDTTKGVDKDAVRQAAQRLVENGAQAIAVSGAFSVDDAHDEEAVVSIAQELNLPVTCGSEVSKLYGLKVRTRTAVINAAMLPKMIETANMTEQSVRQAGIEAPIMIMRSDGGVMDIEAMRRRPILTMLSGPAAGVAAAMMYLNISDGIFAEVGGTSTDISVIHNGKALVKGAEIGGHRVYMRTLDVKTVGVAGGSMLRTQGNKLVDVGPRSAHIAGLGYVSFNAPYTNPEFKHVQPKPSDPNDYLAMTQQGQPDVCLTPTCAANFLDLVPQGDCAFGNKESVTAAFSALGKFLHSEPIEIARHALTLASNKCQTIISQFITDYKLDAKNVTLVGGGGGAAAIVPFLAKVMGMDHQLAENADVISAIGVALALVRETVERNIINPKPDDILRIRQEAFASVHKMGADPAGIEVHVEVDPRANVVRATAFGAAGLHKSGIAAKQLSESQRMELAAKSLKAQLPNVKVLAKTPAFEVFGADVIERRMLGLLPTRYQSLRTMDDKGVIRLQTKNGVVKTVNAADADKAAVDLAEEYSHYGDAGKILPNLVLLAGPRIIDLSGIADTAQISALARTELQSSSPDAPTIIIAGIE